MNSILPAPILAIHFNLGGPDLLINLLIIILIALAYIILFPAILQWLWNMTIPQVFGLRTITFWQAFRLMLIFGILFGRVAIR